MEGVQEVVLPLLDAVVARYEQVVVRNERAGDQWLPETGNWFGLLVERKQLRHVEVVQLLTLVVDDRQEEFAVILVCHGEVLCVVGLLTQLRVAN